MSKIEVGKKFEANVQEDLSISFDETGFTVVFKLDNLLDKEIAAFKTGNLRIDVAFLEKIIFFAFTNTGGIGDADIPFTIHLSKVKEMQELGENQGYAMKLILVEANNNIIKGFRYIGLNTNTSKYLKKCVMEQLSHNFDNVEHERNINKIKLKYDTKKIIELASAYSNFKEK